MKAQNQSKINLKIKMVLAAILFVGCNSETKKQENSELSQIHTVILDTLKQNKTPYTKWEEFGNDSLEYLIKNFVKREEVYKRKPINTILEDLELPILTFNTMSSYPPKDKEVQGITLNLEKSLSAHLKLERKKSPLSLNIYFEQPLIEEKVRAFIVKNSLTWSPTVRSYFQAQIVKKTAIVKHITKPAEVFSKRY